MGASEAQGAVHLFLGEPYQRQQALQEILHALEAAGSLGKLTFEGDKVTPGQLQEALFSPSLFETGRLALIHHADEFSDWAYLTTLIQRKFPHRVYLLLEAEKLDKRSALFRALKEHGQIHEFAPLDRRTLPGKIKDMLTARKVKLDARAFQYVVNTVPPDLPYIENEIRKISLFPRRGELDLEDVQGLLFSGQSTTVFQFLDALGERNALALSQLAELLDSGEEPGKLFFMLASHLRSLLLLKGFQQQALSPAELGQRSGMPPWLAQRRLQQVRRWTQEELMEAIHRLHDEDVLIKQGQRQPADSLTLLVLEWTGFFPHPRMLSQQRSERATQGIRRED